MFCYLFGWDYDFSVSVSDGGILGKVKAFYGTSEFTECSCLHSHFLIWLVGGFNPSDLHVHLEGDPEHQRQFFDFFEGIIHYHLPDIGIDINESSELWTQRPPPVPKMLLAAPQVAELPTLHADLIDILNNWDSVFATEIKLCGEVLQ